MQVKFFQQSYNAIWRYGKKHGTKVTCFLAIKLMKDIQFVYVNISPEVAQERAKSRYTMSLNTNKDIGGRFLPQEIIEKCRTNNKYYQSKNAESVAELSHDKNIDIPTPLVYDNTGSGQIKVDSKKFLRGEYENEFN